MEDPEALKNIMNDPQVKAYMNQVEDLMKDPAMKQQMEQLANQFKNQVRLCGDAPFNFNAPLANTLPFASSQL